MSAIPPSRLNRHKNRRNRPPVSYVQESLTEQQRRDLKRVFPLIEHDKQADVVRALAGHPNQPDDPGVDGPAAVARERTTEDAEGKSAGSASRHGIRSYRTRIACECVLDGLFRNPRGILGYDQWKAGMQFRRYWMASRHAARISGQYGDRFGGTGALQETEYRSEARWQVDRALEALTPAQRRAVTAVCGEDQLLGLRGKVLVAGLDVLVKLWIRPKKNLDGR